EIGRWEDARLRDAVGPVEGRVRLSDREAGREAAQQGAMNDAHGDRPPAQGVGFSTHDGRNAQSTACRQRLHERRRIPAGDHDGRRPPFPQAPENRRGAASEEPTEPRPCACVWKRLPFVSLEQRDIPLERHAEADALLCSVGEQRVVDLQLQLGPPREGLEPRHLVLDGMRGDDRDAAPHSSTCAGRVPATSAVYSLAVRCAYRSQVRPAASSRAAAPIGLRRAASGMASSIAGAIDDTAPDETIQPLRPGTTMSFAPVALDTITASPERIASPTTMPKPSARDGSTSRSGSTMGPARTSVALEPERANASISRSTPFALLMLPTKSNRTASRAGGSAWATRSVHTPGGTIEMWSAGTPAAT